jgi:hypothetical protein
VAAVLGNDDPAGRDQHHRRSDGRGQDRRRGRLDGHLLGAGRAQPGSGTAFQARLRYVVAKITADRFTKIATSVLDHRRFWDAMHTVSMTELAEIEHHVTAAMIGYFALDTSALALDMTNFATSIDTGNAKAPIAQRDKAKQKRSDLRLG